MVTNKWICLHVVTLGLNNRFAELNFRKPECCGPSSRIVAKQISHLNNDL
jgi:hypothetical protein